MGLTQQTERTVEIDCYGLTDRGKSRRANEDQFLIAGLSKAMLVQQTSLSIEDQTRLLGGIQGKLLVVADGMGGAVGGERASYVAVSALTHYVLNTMSWFFRLDTGLEEELQRELRQGLERCQRALEQDPGRREGMGTTVTMAYVRWPELHVVHAGDSRCYLHRRGQLTQLTRDHTVAQQLVEGGDLTPERAEESPMAHVLWNAVVVGGESDLSPEVHRFQLEQGDTLILCTDGLTKHVDDPDIARQVARGQPADKLVQALVDAALHGGGSDNVTVIAARFAGGER